MESEHSAESPRRPPPPSPTTTPPRLSCSPPRHQAGREVEPVTSAVQRSLLDGIGYSGTQVGDDGARVVAADHGAARHDHVGSGLTRGGTETD